MLIAIANSNTTSLSASLAQLEGCWKSSSILWMQSRGFPVLDGLILNSWSPEVSISVERFSSKRKFSELLLRIEARGQRWTQRRGGYHVPLAELQRRIEDLANEGLLAILLEPASPHSDLCSLASVCDIDTHKIDIEVVGAGFDASDLLRSDLTPHERFEIRFEDLLRTPWDVPRLHAVRTHLIGDDSYCTSVRQRLAKIGARLRNPSFPAELIRSPATAEDLVNEAKCYLKQKGYTTLLDHSEQYEPISPRRVNAFLEEVLRLYKAVSQSNVPWRTFSIAASFLSDERLVFWDFFPANPGQHDVRTLLDLKA